ncbi:MAG: stage III sporulation protein AD [Firmicutes bacterium]|nr:stage III sporulation protein AD [Bacillota bacterium]
MTIETLVLAGLVATFLVTTVRQARPELGLLLSLAAGALIFLALLVPIMRVVDILRDLALRAHVDVYYLGVILRIVGVAYLTQFAAEVARDAGEGALAAKIEFGGKVAVLVIALPVVLSLVELVVRLMAQSGA